MLRRLSLRVSCPASVKRVGAVFSLYNPTALHSTTNHTSHHSNASGGAASAKTTDTTTAAAAAATADAASSSLKHTKVTFQPSPDMTVDSTMRIFESTVPSVLQSVHMHDCLFAFMREAWARQPPNKIAIGEVAGGSGGSLASVHNMDVHASLKSTLTYAELITYTTRVRDHLFTLRNGVRAGDNVMVMLFNTKDYAPVVFGVLAIGASVSLSHTAVTPLLLARQMEASGARVVVVTRQHHRVVHAAQRELAKLVPGASLKIVLVETLLRGQPESMPHYLHPTDKAQRDDTVVVPFSAGAQGEPKGVALTNISLVSNIHQAIAALELTDRDTHLAVLPFYHATGFTLALCATLASGGTLLTQKFFEVQRYVEAMHSAGVTWTLVTSPLVSALEKRRRLQNGALALPGVRLIRNTGGKLTPAKWAALEAIFPNASVGQIYGMTEMSPLALATPLRLTAEAVAAGTHTKGALHHRSVGALVADTQMRIVRVDEHQESLADATSGVDAEPGAAGEIWLRGPQRMKGYLDPRLTRVVLQPGGWYRTGDVGFVDPGTGLLYLTDRLRELIKYKGFYISPMEIEEVLRECGEVKDVAVTGVRDNRHAAFELPRALVVLKRRAYSAAPEALTPDEHEAARASVQRKLMKHVEARLPEYKWLHGGLRFVDSIPRTVSGNVRRRLVRQTEHQLMLEGLAESEHDE